MPKTTKKADDGQGLEPVPTPPVPTAGQRAAEQATVKAQQELASLKAQLDALTARNAELEVSAPPPPQEWPKMIYGQDGSQVIVNNPAHMAKHEAEHTAGRPFVGSPADVKVKKKRKQVTKTVTVDLNE